MGYIDETTEEGRTAERLIRFMKSVENPSWMIDLVENMHEKLEEYKDLEEQGKLLKEWIPCSERLPESEKDVEITYVRKHWNTGEPVYFTARAFYEDGTINTADSSFNWEDTDNWEYDEEKDCYIIPEGWFESVSFAEEFGTVDSPVIAWKEIVEPYKPEREV